MKTESWHTKARIDFRDSAATGPLDPEEISRRLNLPADSKWITGDRIGKNGTVRRRTNGWQIMTEKVEGANPADQIRELLARLGNSWSIACELGKILEAEISLEIWTDGRMFPPLIFEPKLLAAAIEMNATVDIDMY